MKTAFFSNSYIAAAAIAFTGTACSGAGGEQDYADDFGTPSDETAAEVDTSTLEAPPTSHSNGYAEAAASYITQTRSTILGNVDAAYGERLEGVEVCAVDADAAYCAQTDERGHYGIEGVPADATFELTFTKDGYVPAADSVHTDQPRNFRDGHLLANDQISEEQLQEVGCGGLLIRVLDWPTGWAPSGYADVTIDDATIASIAPHRDLFPTEAATDEDGLLLVGGVAPGTVELTAAELVGEGCSFYDLSAQGPAGSLHIAAGAVTSVTIACKH